jgi:hypothetical protein
MSHKNYRLIKLRQILKLQGQGRIIFSSGATNDSFRPDLVTHKNVSQEKLLRLRPGDFHPEEIRAGTSACNTAGRRPGGVYMCTST